MKIRIYYCFVPDRSSSVEMDNDGSDEQGSTEVTPASSENDLHGSKSSEGSVEEEEEEEDDDDIDKMLNELASFQEASDHFSFTCTCTFTPCMYGTGI